MKNLALFFLLAWLCCLPQLAQAASFHTPTVSLEATTLGELATQSPRAWADDLDRPLTRAERRLVRRAHRLVKRHPELAHQTISDVAPPMDGLAVAGFVLGVVSLLSISFVGFGAILLGILGVVFSAIAMRRLRDNRDSRRGYGLAIAGFVTGLVTVALLLLLAVIISLIFI